MIKYDNKAILIKWELQFRSDVKKINKSLDTTLIALESNNSKKGIMTNSKGHI